jgi:glutathione peroxidase
MSDIYDFTAKTLAGAETKLAEWRGKVLLIVNTASQCGFTPQYSGLEALWRKYKDRGFAVLGFPCNQFGKQEPGDASEIAKFCSLKYDVTFPMFEKIEVNGPNAHPIYAFLKDAQPGCWAAAIK